MKNRASIAHPFRWMAASLLLAASGAALLPSAARADARAEDAPPPPHAGHPMRGEPGFAGMPLQ
ncbi:MAG: hypothetical protein IIZ92_14540, partial [Aquincola sp.]|nr:hypothetical protein [Aquincola sp.]